MSEKLEQSILILKKHLEKLKNQYHETPAPEDKKDRALFDKVKEETTPLFKLCEEWSTLANEYIKEDAGCKVFPLQIQNTKENYELMLLHSYYIDVPKKRFMELYHSVHFVFDQLLQCQQKDDRPTE